MTHAVIPGAEAWSQIGFGEVAEVLGSAGFHVATQDYHKDLVDTRARESAKQVTA